MSLLNDEFDYLIDEMDRLKIEQQLKKKTIIW